MKLMLFRRINMNKSNTSFGWKSFLIGSFALFALCAIAAIGFFIISSVSSPHATVPLYSNPQQSFDSAPQREIISTPQILEQPVDTNPQLSFDSASQQEPTLAPQPQTSIDPNLVGHWRYTEILGSGDFTIVTDYHIIFGSDGMFSSYSEGEDGQTQNYVEGNWSASDTVITFTSDGTSESYGYQIVNAYLIFEGTTNQFWERIDP
jgi:hypothetical protein